MKVLKIEDQYRVFPSQEGQTYLINDRFPLHWLVYYLSVHKNYSRELAINHVKDYYDLDISELLHDEKISYLNWNSKNIYMEHLSNYPRRNYKDKDRNYFQSSGRSYFLKFTNNPYKDFVNESMDMDVVHHIFPLVFGGSNKLENLIPLNDYNHDILHSNPREEIEKYCHQAVDYLWYLYSYWDSEKNSRILNKYGIHQIHKSNPDNHNFIIEVYLSAIKSEMNEFYRYIENI